jgi:amino acid adenylation domain-containing protein/non-ribosomal peptide synthase protein (TIGR01720 family)
MTNQVPQIQSIHPLTPLQQGMLIHTLLAAESGVYVTQAVLTLVGDVQDSTLQRAWHSVLDRHEVLRSFFVWKGQEKPLQIVPRQVVLPWEQLDWSGFSASDQRVKLESFLRADRKQGFDLSKAPLMRLTLIRTADHDHELVWTTHHLLLDGWSTFLVIKDVVAVYRALREGQELHLPDCRPFRDYIGWLQRQDRSKAEAFWRAELKEFNTPTPLGVDRPAPTLRGHRDEIASAQEHWPGELTRALRAFGARHNLTSSTLVHGAWAMLLNRYSGQASVLFGSVVSGRPAELQGVESMVGLLINTLPVLARISPATSVLSWLKAFQDHLVGLQQYQHSSLVDIQGWCEVRRDQPLFESLLAFENYRVDASLWQRHADLEIANLRGIEQTNYPLTVTVVPGEELVVKVDYSVTRFDAESITRLLAHFRTLLEGMVLNPDQRVSDLPMLTDAERQQLLVEWNGTEVAYPDRSLHELIEEQAGRTPDQVAVVFEQEILTYAELNRRANQLARYLRARGVGPDRLVGLFIERSTEMLVGILGILKAGGAYVPLDPGYPKKRLRYILEDANAPIVLTQESLIRELPSFGGQVVCLDVDWPAIAGESPDNLATQGKSANLAYVLFTSGSTGRPKGVALEHRTAATFVQWAKQVFTPQELSAVLFSTSVCFDLSVFEMFVTLSAGGKIIVARNALHLPTLPAKDEVTLINTVPSAIAELLRMGAVPASVKTVNLAGEVLPDTLVEQIYATTNVEKVYNLYGPTEATTYSTYTLVRRGAPVTIGRPIANTQTYILDPYRNPVPIGVMGELYLAGDGLARGYLGRPELTNERFVPNPFSEEKGRMYRTGDLCRWLPDGSIQYLGRTDHQVKLRGFRIELGEIEATLDQHPAVRQSVVIVRGDEAGRKQLVAYVALKSGAGPATRELYHHVKERLPEFMMPSAIVPLDAFPLNPNGKIDRTALPEPDLPAELRAPFVAARTANEKILADIWSQVLPVQRVGVHDKFFELGGDSILAIQVVAGANQAGLRLTVKQMFQHQTIAELALVAENIAKSVSDHGPVTGEVPLTPIQRWFFEQDFADPHHWNQAVCLELRRNLEPALLNQAVRELVMHHDALRLRFWRQAEGWRQFNAAAAGTVSLRRIDLSKLRETDQNSAMRQSSTELQAQLDLAERPLLQGALFDLGPLRRSRLLIVIHHLAVDGVSWRILLEDLQIACDQLGRGEAIKLPAKTNSFKQWAQRLTEHARTTTFQQEADYWLADSTVEPTALPVDVVHGNNSEASARVVSAALEAETTRTLLQRVPQAYNTHINDVLLSALGLALSRWIDRPTVAIDLEGHGREDLFQDIDLSRTVGWFTTIFPLRLDLRRTAGPGDVLKSVKEQLRRVPQRGIGYALLKYLAGNAKVAAQLRAMPKPQVVFNYLGQFDLPATSPFAWVWEPTGPLHSPRARRSHLLEINSWVAGDQLRVDWTYSENVHRRGTIEQLAESYLEELRDLIRHCTSPEAGGYTPSDFADAGLNQAELDRLIADLS